MNIAPTGEQAGYTHGIHEAQISLAICGSDDSRWVAYAFVDTEFAGVSRDEYEDNFEINEDPIASDSRGREVEADSPIWDPREYFLRIVDIRMKQVLGEWTYLIRVVERSVKGYV